MRPFHLTEPSKVVTAIFLLVLASSSITAILAAPIRLSPSNDRQVPSSEHKPAQLAAVLDPRSPIFGMFFKGVKRILSKGLKSVAKDNAKGGVDTIAKDKPKPSDDSSFESWFKNLVARLGPQIKECAQNLFNRLSDNGGQNMSIDGVNTIKKDESFASKMADPRRKKAI